MSEKKVSYVSHLGNRGIFAEIYFPKKIVRQGTIFDTLRDGFNENRVKKYLSDNVVFLLHELREYPDLFDPNQYKRTRSRIKRYVPTKEDAKKRIKDYSSPFHGWSLYQVEGVFFEKGKIDEELIQVLRIMFKFESSYDELASQEGCFDVLRSMIFWVMNNEGILDHENFWNTEERKRYIRSHSYWPQKKLSFIQKHFTEIAKEVAQWIDNCIFFIFGYLVREFAQNVIAKGPQEKVIWVTSFLNLNINVIKREEENKKGK